MLQTIENKLKFDHLKKVYWYLIKKKIFLVLVTKNNNKKYISLFKFSNIYKNLNIYHIKNNISRNFYNFILKCSEKFYKPLQKKLFFKGLGFKFKYSTVKKDKLELKLGFSHLVTLFIPKKEIKVFLIKKNRLAIEGFNYGLVGNFAQKIKMLRFPDSYNGKGFWYKNEFKILKQIKKT